MFPREIVDMIIDNLHDDIQALLQLSLVSFTTSHSSRRHLLHSLTIRLEKLELFLLDCASHCGSRRGSASCTEAAQNSCPALATFRDCTRNIQLVCTAGVGRKECWELRLQAVGRIPLVLSSMKSLELVDFPFHRLYAPLELGSAQSINLSSLQTALGLSTGCPKSNADEKTSIFHAIETLVIRSTTGFIHYEPLHILLAYFFPNVRKLVCRESDEQCSFLVPCGSSLALPKDAIPLPQLCKLELLYPSKDIYTLLLHGPYYLKNIENLVLEDGPCFAGRFKGYDILREVGQQLKSLRLNLDAVAKGSGFEPRLWNLSQNPNLTTLVLHTRYTRHPRRRCSTASAAWMIEILNAIDSPRLSNLILLVEQEVDEQTAQGDIDLGLQGLLCEFVKCKNDSLLGRLEEFWIMYKPASENQPAIEGVVVEEYILGLFGLDATTADVMPRVKVVKSVDGILDGFG